MKNAGIAAMCLFGTLCIAYADTSKQAHHPIRKSVSTGGKASTSPSIAVLDVKLQKSVQRFQNDPLATYKVIMRAAHQHLGPQAAVAYSQLLKSRQDDPHIQSAYAFSQFMAVGPLSENYFVANPSSLVKKIRLDNLKAEYYYELSLKSVPKSGSVVQLECALMGYYYAQSASTSATKKDQEAAVNSLSQVTKDNPGWADAHYWLADILNLYAAAVYSEAGPEKTQAQTMSLGQEMVTEATKAEQDDPGYHTDCLKLYAYAYQWLQQPKQTLKFLDLYLQANPSQKESLQIWRQGLLTQMQK